MPKNIVFCADGTWYGPGQPDTDDQNSPASNVFKLFLDLDGAVTPATAQLAKEQERQLTAADGSVVQLAKYLQRCRRRFQFSRQAAWRQPRRRADHPDRAWLYLHLTKLPGGRQDISLGVQPRRLYGEGAGRVDLGQRVAARRSGDGG